MSKKGAAIALAATTTGSLSLAGMANAATPSQWDKVANCESTNDWNINTGNGFFGGLQFTQKTWDEFGGRTFASRADLATKQQQITVAEKVLAAQGKGAWPVCGSGLTNDPIKSVSTVGSNVAKPSAKLVSDAQKIPASVPRPKQNIGAGSYTVVSGDTLFSISAKLRISLNSLISLNPQIRNPAMIFAGDKVILPAHSTQQPVAKLAVTQSVQTNPSVVSAAKSFLGDPYLFGGTSSSGLDCSGLIQAAYKKVGISLPRTADQQMRVSRTISRAQLLPGDLAFSVNPKGNAYHVALYIGNGQVLESPKPGSVVSVRPLYSALNRFGRIQA